MSSNSIPKHTVVISPFVEAAAAVWRTETSLDEQPGPRQPVINSLAAKAFVDEVLTPSEHSLLKDALNQWNLYKVIQLGLSSGNQHVHSSNQLYSLCNDPDFNHRVMAQLERLYKQYDIRRGKITELYQESRFWETSLYAELVEGNVSQFALIPSIFMLPAPRGQTGFIEVEDGYKITLIFGFTGPVNDDTTSSYPDWRQWFRNGVWHFLARSYWNKKTNNGTVKDNRLLEKAFALLREPHTLKVDISNFKITTYRSWIEFAVEHLVFSTRLICEREVGGEQAYQEKRKWYYSLGRFHIHWFTKILEHSFKDIKLEDLCSAWISEAELLLQPPRFVGPLGACENPLWSDRINILFSPSISAGTQRAVGIWIANYWRVKPERMDTTALQSIVPDSSYLIFALDKDEDWLMEISKKLTLSFDLAGYDAKLFVERNEHSDKYWSRVTIGKSEQSLLRLNQRANIYMEWSVLDQGEVLSGLNQLRDPVR